jgi:CBS domain-containing protein
MDETRSPDAPAAAEMAVAALTGDPVLRVAADADLNAVARAMADQEVGTLVVGDEDRPEAIISERDLVKALAEGRDPATTTAGELAHTTLIWCEASSTVADVAQEMMDRYVRHVLVEEDGRLVGIVSARDLLGVYASA